MNKYKAFFEGKEADIEAETLYSAKLKAIDHFRAKKNKHHMVSVILCELANSKEVLHIADF